MLGESTREGIELPTSTLTRTATGISITKEGAGVSPHRSSLLHPPLILFPEQSSAGRWSTNGVPGLPGNPIRTEGILKGERERNGDGYATRKSSTGSDASSHLTVHSPLSSSIPASRSPSRSASMSLSTSAGASVAPSVIASRSASVSLTPSAAASRSASVSLTPSAAASRSASVSLSASAAADENGMPTIPLSQWTDAGLSGRSSLTSNVDDVSRDSGMGHRTPRDGKRDGEKEKEGASPSKSPTRFPASIRTFFSRGQGQSKMEDRNTDKEKNVEKDELGEKEIDRGSSCEIVVDRYDRLSLSPTPSVSTSASPYSPLLAPSGEKGRNNSETSKYGGV